ncbi:VOC family protein [Cellulomonas fimi]|uniref:Glyoxalase/bleomycin resistance protein/dioxygenase n=1 Tax=Cellulomonas fimi (strain ATCC 484 / DSM 20113 / JCM 1341 / CCUG 24087 / LMG 16345 / NBRC 15513 / NCIMB 8980 / NCTC 7547 / NRS-133) TaxID=590998 RepID=F4GY37_CELFA|nr:VOC family protein [Cellulomonas fimi]AEE44705.1 Glyoxalase/bleomycin resistance protein/dioxygenase [Cellulomonas fimi ATCC 484]NNH06152.1 VOC family protein [Cellulomonas fimi]VEH27060.1 Glyoxalase-like domain [Cellulomonas fimi]
MHVRVHRAFLPHLDPAASLALYRDVLGLEVREDVGSGSLRWLTFAPAAPSDEASGSGGAALVLGPPIASHGVTQAEHRTVRELMAKGVYATVSLATGDLAGAFARVEACDVVDLLQEPARRPFGGVDFAFLDPAGNVVRVVEAP